MALEQTRPYECDLFNDEVDDSELDILVDHPSFTYPKRIRGAVSSGGSVHIEKDVLSGLASKTVTVEFESEFSSTPIGWIKVYRMTEMPNGTYREQDVLWGHTTSTKVSTTGFVIQIDDSESLTGVIVEYEFK